MKTLSDRVLDQINPPLDISSFAQVESMLQDPACITLCIRSTYDFVKATLRQLIETQTPGHIVLVGVWRGGLAAYLQALLVESGETDRRLYLADTFNGFLPVDDEHPADKRMLAYFQSLRAPSGSSTEVVQRMQDWGLPVDNVVLLEGDVKVTTSNVDFPIALLLVDVDFYQPTKAALDNLYRHVSPGGCVYVDDYGVDEYECRLAVDNFFQEHHLVVKPDKVNRFGIFWFRQAEV